MKLKYLYTLLLVFAFTYGTSQKIDLEVDKSEFTVLEQTATKIVLKSTLAEITFENVKKNGDIYSAIRIPSYLTSHNIGYPDLVTMNHLIDIPYGSDIIIGIKSKTEEIIDLSQHNLHEIYPAQRSISKGEDPSKVKFSYNKAVFKNDAFIQPSPVKVVTLGKMRGHQLGRIEICPFEYNPVQGILKVITEIEFEIIFDNADMGLTKQLHDKYYSKDFTCQFSKLINNSEFQTKDMLTTYPIKYVIVADPAYQASLQPLVDWKTQKGFTVIEAYTNDPQVGSTTTSIKAYLEGLYNAGTPSDPAPSYLLIVGDIAEVPSFSGNFGSHVSDLYFCEYDGGGDFYPELYYGRFPAASVNEVDIMVAKTLEYEKYLFPDPSFLANSVMISGVDASMAPTYGNGQINYGNTYYTNTAHSITSLTYLYPASGSSSSQILQDANNGASFINYTAHGYSGGWADPSFDCADVYNMTNEHKLPLMVGNCCQTNMFDDPECFGEALLRVQNRGAIGYIGGSNNTYWNEDYWWGVGTGSIQVNPVYTATSLGAYDRLFHDHGESGSEWHVTNAQIMVGGNMAVTQAAGAEDYYYEIYHLMGDPSLMTYFGVPAQMNVTHIGSSPIGTSTLTVVAEPDAYVAISMNGVLLDAQLTDPSGTVNLSFTAFSTLGTADVVVTKQNRQPYIGTVQVINTNAPFVSYDSHVVWDLSGNSNGQADYSEQLDIDVTLTNLGSINAFGVTAQLVCTNPYVTITDDNDSWGTILANNSGTVTNAFSVTIANDIPDQEIINYEILVSDNSSGSWNSFFNFTANAPVLNIDNVTLDDNTSGNGNSRLDAGETVTFNIESNNEGNSNCSNLTGTLTSASSYVNITSGVHNFGALTSLTNSSGNFTVYVDPSTPYGTPVEFVYDLVDGAYFDSYTFTEIVGLHSEDFESGGYNTFNWNTGSNNPWTIDAVEVYEGNYSSVSGNINHNQSSTMEIEIDVIANGDISFMKKVSSEDTYDFLKFYIDNQLQGEWSGEVSWSAETFSVSTGVHTFRWVYEKDGSVSDGYDVAWVDYILFPPMDNSVDVENDLWISDVILFPNPGNGDMEMQFQSLETSNILVSVYDCQGKQILFMNEKVNSGSNVLKIDISGKAKGLYLIHIANEGRSLTKEIILQ